MTALIDRYDAALFDLDGVVYLGPAAVPGAASALARLRSQGVKVGFVTNNAARSPETVAAHLRQLSIEATADDVVTSAQAVARLMGQELPPGAAVLVVGTAALLDEVRSVGLTPVADSTQLPAAVVVGFAPDLTWAELNEAAYAVQHGAVWYGCNPDRTRPTDRGLAIGLGAMLDAMAEVLPGQSPIVAGKPYRPLLDETVRRLQAERPLFVGDRLDTDIEGAQAVGMDSLFVLSGSHGAADLLAAPPQQRPTFVAADLAGLLLLPVVVDESLVTVTGDQVRPAPGVAITASNHLAVLWASAHAAWRLADSGRAPVTADLLAAWCAR